MKKFLEGLISSKFTLILLFILAFALGAATFIENSYDTSVAKALIYNARWFEFILLLIVINMIGSIIVFKLYKIERIGGFLFHVGFIVMIIGAAATRYIGFEGTMHIREGSLSSEVYTNEPYFIISSPADDYNYDFRINNKSFGKHPFKFHFSSKQKGNVNITLKDYIPNAQEQIQENQNNGNDMITIRYSINNKVHNTYIFDGEIKNIEGYKIAFNNTADDTAINISGSNDKGLMIMSNKKLFIITGDGNISDSIQSNKSVNFSPDTIYQRGNLLFLLTHFYKKAKIVYIPGNSNTQTVDAIIADVEINGKKHEIPVFGGKGYSAALKSYDIDGLPLILAFGSKQVSLPFSLYLNDFILDRYPGSMSPSSYESDVTLIDKQNNINKKHRIYMNHILNYRGYRFFQSSYDTDEKGTILSVSHDSVGTFITYFSYILLLAGFIIVFFSKKSRFTAIRKEVKNSKKGRKIITSVIILLFAISNTAFSQQPVNKLHADKFGHLIVQSFDGRFEPVQTIALDVVHKISKKNTIKIDGKGSLSAIQVFLDMMVEPQYWETQQIIYIKNKALRNIIGIPGKYASYNDFFNKQHQYKLSDLSEKAYRTDVSERNAFDREIINVEERLNIFMMTVRGSMLKIFPEQNSENHKWLSIDDSLSFMPLTGNLQVINDDLNLNVLNYNNILQLYLQNVKQAKINNNYSQANKLLGYMSTIQRQLTSHESLPSEQKINVEIFYNKANIFSMLIYIYMILSLVLIILAFFNHFVENPTKFLRFSLNFFIILLAAAFLYHTFGLGLRWYLSGHAPWSGGYGALIFVAWGGILAGFVFMKHSKITLAATALLAFFVMLTAGFSSYDPQLTNLQPVLKSYWLIIHVAVIIISYGFLGLGFVLGLLNLIMYVLKNKKNAARLGRTIKELTNINEMNLTIGIVLATIGTFLGAVWANESWGKYWGWDAKETWALIIIIVYAILLHLRLVPGLKGRLLFNIGSVVAFGSVIMTFAGVNFYFSKGLHSYAQGGTVVFPIWAWATIGSFILLFIVASIKHRKLRNITENE